MDNQSSVTDFSQHYLQVQALTSTDPSQNQQPVQLSTSFISYSILIFISVLTIGVIYYLASRFKERSYLSNTLKLAMALSVIPMGLGVIGIQTQLTSQAGPDEIPINVTITNVSDSQFNLQFTTNSKTKSGIKVSTDPSMEPIKYVQYSDLENSTTTHNYTINLLSPNTTYYLLIYSSGVWYDNQGSPLQVTTTN